MTKHYFEVRGMGGEFTYSNIDPDKYWEFKDILETSEEDRTEDQNDILFSASELDSIWRSYSPYAFNLQVQEVDRNGEPIGDEFELEVHSLYCFGNENAREHKSSPYYICRSTVEKGMDFEFDIETEEKFNKDLLFGLTIAADEISPEGGLLVGIGYGNAPIEYREDLLKNGFIKEIDEPVVADYFEEPHDSLSDITLTLIQKGLENLEFLKPFHVDNLEDAEYEGYTKSITINLIDGNSLTVETFETPI